MKTILEIKERLAQVNTSITATQDAVATSTESVEGLSFMLSKLEDEASVLNWVLNIEE